MPGKQGTVFDGAAGDMFAREVYGSTKGDVRLHVLWQDLLTEIPALERRRKLRVIDIGGGMGQIAARVAALGHDVTLCDASPAMLRKARATMRRAGADDVRFVHATLQDARGAVDGRFEVVLCHAVLEWLVEPRRALRHLASLMTGDGYLSLLFYNRNAALLKRALAGDFAGVLAERPQRGGPAPLDPDEVRSWAASAGLRLQSASGVRIFHDHLSRLVGRGKRLERLIELETAYRKREPFASIAQHVHFVCRRR
jgi:S-adenosylmethionine-dependent methyltransferase